MYIDTKMAEVLHDNYIEDESDKVGTRCDFRHFIESEFRSALK